MALSVAFFALLVGRLEVRLEQLVPISFTYPHALVSDPNLVVDYLSIDRRPTLRHLNHDAIVDRGKLDRVLYEVNEYLLDPQLV